MLSNEYISDSQFDIISQKRKLRQHRDKLIKEYVEINHIYLKHYFLADLQTYKGTHMNESQYLPTLRSATSSVDSLGFGL